MCTGYSSVAVIKHHDQKQQKEGLVGVCSSRWIRVRKSREKGSKEQAWWEKQEADSSHLNWHGTERVSGSGVRLSISKLAPEDTLPLPWLHHLNFSKWCH